MITKNNTPAAVIIVFLIDTGRIVLKPNSQHVMKYLWSTFQGECTWYTLLYWTLHVRITHHCSRFSLTARAGARDQWQLPIVINKRKIVVVKWLIYCKYVWHRVLGVCYCILHTTHSVQCPITQCKCVQVLLKNIKWQFGVVFIE